MSHTIVAKFVRVVPGRENELGNKRMGVYSIVAAGLNGMAYIGQGHVMERVTRRRELERELEEAPAFIAALPLKRDALLLEWLLISVGKDRGTSLSLKNRRGPEYSKVTEAVHAFGGELRVELANRDPLSGAKIDQPLRFGVSIQANGVVYQKIGSK